MLGSAGGTTTMFGTQTEVDPVSHMIGTAVGWGGNPRSAAIYDSGFPKANEGKTVHTITVKGVPVDGFWSISLYNAKGYFEKNDLGAYSVNNLTAKPNPDDSFTIQFGGGQKDTPNFLPIMPGWNYIVRLYPSAFRDLERYIEVSRSAAQTGKVRSSGTSNPTK